MSYPETLNNSLDLLSALKNRSHIVVMFFASWCGHCQHAKPVFTGIAKSFYNGKTIGSNHTFDSYFVDCSKGIGESFKSLQLTNENGETKRCEEVVRGFPTFLRLWNFNGKIYYSEFFGLQGYTEGETKVVTETIQFFLGNKNAYPVTREFVKRRRRTI
jgi:thiol-disulfide isomerase/thioredoxin